MFSKEIAAIKALYTRRDSGYTFGFLITQRRFEKIFLRNFIKPIDKSVGL